MLRQNASYGSPDIKADRFQVCNGERIQSSPYFFENNRRLEVNKYGSGYV